jgi:hypothetical protein
LKNLHWIGLAVFLVYACVYLSLIAIPQDHPDIAFKGRWGTHISAFAIYPQETSEQIMPFIDSTIRSL